MQLHAFSNKRKESNMMQKSAGEDHRASQHFCHVLAYMWWMYKTVFPNIGVRKFRSLHFVMRWAASVTCDETLNTIFGF